MAICVPIKPGTINISNIWKQASLHNQSIHKTSDHIIGFESEDIPFKGLKK